LGYISRAQNGFIQDNAADGLMDHNIIEGTLQPSPKPLLQSCMSLIMLAPPDNTNAMWEEDVGAVGPR
jgi:hypothetical protein